MGELFVVATPIGNLEDITLRALRVLGEVDIILCEDTRTTKKLLSHYQIDTPTLSYHSHSGEMKVGKILSLLEEGKNLALVSDAGTPAISDPGSKLIFEVSGAGYTVSSVPGPSALTAALSIAGVPTHPFLFLGFIPQKKGRKSALESIAQSPTSVVLYESTHRIQKLLEECKAALPTRTITIAKELTKIHERVLTGTAEELLGCFEEDPELIRGEFVVIVSPQ